MSDIAIVWDGMKSDLCFGKTDIKADEGLETAVLISLFTEKRANNERGFWGDTYEDEPMGSRLWLLSREKRISDVVERANEYTSEALQWMIKAGIAKTVSVDSYIEKDRLFIPVEITKPSGDALSFKYSANWNSLSS